MSTLPMFCGVMSRNCLPINSRANRISISMLTSRLTLSMKTSNSSRHRTGAPMASHVESGKQMVEKGFFPSDRSCVLRPVALDFVLSGSTWLCPQFLEKPHIPARYAPIDPTSSPCGSLAVVRGTPLTRLIEELNLCSTRNVLLESPPSLAPVYQSFFKHLVSILCVRRREATGTNSRIYRRLRGRRWSRDQRQESGDFYGKRRVRSRARGLCQWQSWEDEWVRTVSLNETKVCQRVSQSNLPRDACPTGG